MNRDRSIQIATYRDLSTSFAEHARRRIAEMDAREIPKPHPLRRLWAWLTFRLV